MTILQNAYKISLNQRKIMAFVALSFVLTNTPIHATRAAEISQKTTEITENAVNTANIAESTVKAEETKLPALRTARVAMTSYNSIPNQTDGSPFITADGSCVADDVVAANFLKIGTKIRIPELFGEKVFTVKDRMNPRYDYRVDVWMKDIKASRQFGLKRNVRIEIVEEGTGKKHWDEKNTDAGCQKKLENA